MEEKLDESSTSQNTLNIGPLDERPTPELVGGLLPS